MIYAAGTNRAGAMNRLPGYSKFARGRFVITDASKSVDPVDGARSSWQSNIDVRTNRARLDVISIGTTAVSKTNSTLPHCREQSRCRRVS